MKIGILGGTFDPIHVVHLMVADQVLGELQLDQVWFMPANVPPHKEGTQVTDAVHRLEMVRRAVDAIEGFRAFPYELERPGPSYTIDTLKELKEDYPEHEFYFIIGGDMIEYLPHWHQIDELVSLVCFVGVRRPGYSVTDNEYSPFVKLVDMPLMDISSTLIRERVKTGKSIRFLVPEQVKKYIEENRLYES